MRARVSARPRREALLHGKTNQASGISPSKVGERRRRKEEKNELEEYEIFPGGAAGCRKNRGPQCAPIFIRGSLVALFAGPLDFVPFCSGREHSEFFGAWMNRALRPSLIKLSSYRASGTQLVFSTQLVDRIARGRWDDLVLRLFRPFRLSWNPTEPEMNVPTYNDRILESEPSRSIAFQSKTRTITVRDRLWLESFYSWNDVFPTERWP